MGVRIGVIGESEAEVRAELPRLVRLGYKPEGPVVDTYGEGRWMLRARLVCGLYRKDSDGLPLPELCGRHPRHPDPGEGCGEWEPELVRCTVCGRSGAEHTRDYMLLTPSCTAWPPED
jgi:hypothetical protein